MSVATMSGENRKQEAGTVRPQICALQRQANRMEVSALSLKPRELVCCCFVLESVESETEAGPPKAWHSLVLRDD